MKRAENNSGGGIGICGVLTLIFVVLKLTGNIDWSWWGVLSPLWIGLLLVLLIIGVIILLIKRDVIK